MGKQGQQFPGAVPMAMVYCAGLTWRRESPAALRRESGEESWRMGETEVFRSGAGLIPGGVAGTCRVDGGDPSCKDQSTPVMQKRR